MSYRKFSHQPSSLLWHSARLVIAAAVMISAVLAGHAQDVLTHHYDFARTGVQTTETQLTTANVNTKTFGKLFSLPVDGRVYAQPLYLTNYKMADGKLHNVLIVATQHDSVYAFDANGVNPAAGYYWKISLLGAGEVTVTSGDVGTSDITGEIGITGTPVIDRTQGVIYVVGKSKLISGSNTTFIQRIHALDVATGSEKMSGPTVIAATVPGSGDNSDGTNVHFNALTQNQRAGLALGSGSVWIGWASHGDNRPYSGWVIGYNATNLTKQTGVFNTTPNGSMGGIWQSAGGLAVDSTGHIFVSVGNGIFDGNVAGNLDFAESELKLTPGTSTLTLANTATDYFTPYNANNLSGEDLDFGTSPSTLLPDQTGKYPHLLVTTEKGGEIYLLNRDSLGGFNATTNNDVQDFSDGGFDVHQSMAFFNNHLYLAPDGGPLSYWTFDPTTQQFGLNPVTAQDSTFGCDGCDGAGATPSISANGATSSYASAIVWILDNSNYGGGPAVLHAFPGTLATELYNSTLAAANRDVADIAVKFTTPTIANGFVYVGGYTSVTVYGLFANAPPTAAAPTLSPGPGDFSTAPVPVTLSDTTTGAIIYYTLDGTTPSAASKVYSTPLSLTTTTYLQAIATAPGKLSSGVVGGLYVVAPPAGNVFTLDSGFTSSTIVTNGSAKISSTRLRLTDGNGTEAGSGYYPRQLKVSNFSTSFDFQLTNAQADGFTFVVQNSGKNALGQTGGALGYGGDGPGLSAGGIPSSAAIKFDLYDNSGEGVDSTGLFTDGTFPDVPAIDLSGSGIDLHSGDPMNAAIGYDGQHLTIKLTDLATNATASQSYAVNLPAVLGSGVGWVGFTGGTGGLTAVQDILNWTWSAPVTQHLPVTGLPVTVVGPALKTYSAGGFPGGQGLVFNSTAVGQSVTFTVNVTVQGTYQIQFIGDTAVDRGATQLAVDGTNVGSPIIEYSTKAAQLTVVPGTVFLTAGAHAFKFTTAAKPAGSTGNVLSFGEITLIP